VRLGATTICMSHGYTEKGKQKVEEHDETEFPDLMNLRRWRIGTGEVRRKVVIKNTLNDKWTISIY
jgi:hypothetical protein